MAAAEQPVEPVPETHWEVAGAGRKLLREFPVIQLYLATSWILIMSATLLISQPGQQSRLPASRSSCFILQLVALGPATARARCCR